MAALNERPPVTIRANTLRISREDLAARLRDEELAETDPTRARARGPHGRARGGVGRWAAFAAGWCAIQDEASMLIARLLDPQPGELVADTCAAPGTKTTHMAQLMGNRGRIVAMDPHAARLGLADPGGVPARRRHRRGRTRAAWPRSAGAGRAAATGCWWTRPARTWACCAATPT